MTEPEYVEIDPRPLKDILNDAYVKEEVEFIAQKAIDGLELFIDVCENGMTWRDLSPELLKKFKDCLFNMGIISSISHEQPWSEFGEQ